MAAAKNLRVNLIGDTSRLNSAFSGIGGKVRSVAGTVAKLGVTAAAAGVTAAAAFGVKAVLAASDLNETLTKTQQVFGGATDRVTGFADKMGKAFGLPKQEMLDAASNIGLVAKASGLGEQGAAKMSVQMAQLAADASSFFNVPLPDALEKIRSGLVGEAEPLREFGVLLSAAAVEEKALELGIATAGEELTEQQKVMARAAIITEQMSDASGDLERTQGSLANRIKAIQGRFQNFAADLGTTLLPVAEKVVAWADKQLPKAFKLVERTFDRVGVGVKAFFGALREGDVTSDGFVGVMERIGVFVKRVIDGFKSGTGPIAQWKDAFALLGGPLGLVVKELLPALQPLIAAIVTPLAQIANSVGPPLVQVFASLANAVLPPLIAILEGLATLFEAQPGLVVAIVAAWATFRVAALISGFIGLVSALRGVVVTLNLMRVALLANPFVALAAAVVAIAVLVIFNWDKIKNATLTAFNAVKNAVLTAVSAVVGFLKRNWPLILGVIAGPIAAVVALIITNWDRIKSVFRTAISAVVGFVRELPGRAVSALSSLGGLIAGVASRAFNRFLAAGRAVAGAVMSFVRGIPGRIIGALGNLGRLLWSAGGDIIRGLVDGIKSKAGAVAGAIDDALGGIPGKVAGFFGIGSPSKMFRGFGRALGEGLALGIGDGERMVSRAVGSLNAAAAPSAANGRPGSSSFASGAAGGRAVTVNFNGPVVADDEASARRLADFLGPAIVAKLRQLEVAGS